MIGTEFLKGQGLGNRLFCYVTARAIAADAGVTFCTAGREHLDADFLLLDLGEEVSDPSGMKRYDEKDVRLYLPNGVHDMTRGCYVAGADEEMMRVEDGTLLYGNMQAEEYFRNHLAELKDWLRVKEEYESNAYTQDDLCIINFRGSEYISEPALYLHQSYYRHAMQKMRRENPRMRFLVVTEDEEAARKMLPGIPTRHVSAAADYVTVKNARYLILSNSSFGVLPALTSETVRRVIAPKYWARHNVSDGYWASAQNIYDGFEYIDRQGSSFSAEECRAELANYRMPETNPLAEDDPAVLRMRKQQRRRELCGKMIRKVRRMLGIRI
ncbi:MAG: glycosyl transferase [Lachnospiraceae bacterium]|nr:glycosyl transferase [Lachnospiraceae bacterium]